MAPNRDRTRRKWANGNAAATGHERRFDRLSRLRYSEARQTDQSTSQYTLQKLTYTYDAASNITAIADIRDATEVSTYTGGANLPYHLELSYDALYRLLEARYSDGGEGVDVGSGNLRRDMRYAYNDIGNLVKRETTDAASQDNPGSEFYEKWLGTMAYADASHPHAFSAADAGGGKTVSAVYDANGNMTSLEVKNGTSRDTYFTYVWDHYNRLVRVIRTESGAEQSRAYSPTTAATSGWPSATCPRRARSRTRSM